jgi:hypothetical protein
MIKKWLLLLKQVGRRIKEDMSAFFASVAVGFLSLGFYLAVESKDLLGYLLGGAMVLFSMIMMVALIFRIRSEDKQDRAERVVVIKLVGSVLQELIVLNEQLESNKQITKGGLMVKICW